MTWLTGLLADRPLLADVEWKIIGGIVVGLIYLINHIVAVLGKNNRQIGRAPAAPKQAPPAARRQLDEEVSQFSPRQRKPRQEKESPRPRDEARPVRRLTEEAAGLDVVEAQPVDESPSGAKVAAHVQQHLDNREFAERASQLTHVDQAGREIQSHLHQVFDHQVGQLADRKPEQASAPMPQLEVAAISADSIGAMLADPTSLRNALVLNEILQRPTRRW